MIASFLNMSHLVQGKHPQKASRLLNISVATMFLQSHCPRDRGNSLTPRYALHFALSDLDWGWMVTLPIPATHGRPGL
jgi:hypothetical protein